MSKRSRNKELALKKINNAVNLAEEAVLVSLRSSLYKEKYIGKEAITMLANGYNGVFRNKEAAMLRKVELVKSNIEKDLTKIVFEGFEDKSKHGLDDASQIVKSYLDSTKGLFINSLFVDSSWLNGNLDAVIKKSYDLGRMNEISYIVNQFDGYIDGSILVLHKNLKDNNECLVSIEEIKTMIEKHLKFLSMKLSFILGIVYMDKDLETSWATEVNTDAEMKILIENSPVKYRTPIFMGLLARAVEGSKTKGQWESAIVSVLDYGVGTVVEEMKGSEDGKFPDDLFDSIKGETKRIYDRSHEKLCLAVDVAYETIIDIKRNKVEERKNRFLFAKGCTKISNN